MKVRIARIVFLLLTLTSLQNTYAESKPIKVLFIGNSLTFVNDLPGMIKAIAASRGDSLYAKMHAIGGADLRDHDHDPAVTRIIKDRAWDYVILQEQSQRPDMSNWMLYWFVYPYAHDLVKKIRASNNHSHIVFFMTMARRQGDPLHAFMSPDLATYEGMQKRVDHSYIQMATYNHALVAPVGEVWRAVRKARPNLNLYSDNIHPNVTGTYLAACVFYTVIFGKPCSGAYIPSAVDQATGHYIQNLVDNRVLKNRANWDFETYQNNNVDWLSITPIVKGITRILIIGLILMPLLLAILLRRSRGFAKYSGILASFIFSLVGFIGYGILFPW